MKIEIVGEMRKTGGILDSGKVNVALQKKISSGSEANIILEGVVPFLVKPIGVFGKIFDQN